MGWGTAVFLVWSGALSVHDVRRRRLPDVWTVGGGVVTLIVSVAMGGAPWALLGAALWFSLYLVMGIGGVIGGGDVKFSIGLGAWIGWMCAEHTVWAVVIAITVAALVSAIIGVLARSRTVAHGPSMLAGTVVAAYFFGPGIPWEVFA